MNDISVQLQKLPVGCCCGDLVVNDLMCADDIVLLAPSGKGMQTIIDATYAYDNAYDIVFNTTKSQVMIYGTLKIGQAANIMLGDTVEPLSNDHPHQRPSLLYDHISCDGQCFLFVRSLTNDHPSNATNDRVRWNFLPRGRPYRVFQNECAMNIR